MPGYNSEEDRPNFHWWGCKRLVENEGGYFLAEVLLLGLLLVTLSGGFLIYVQSRAVSAVDGCRMQAACLAQAQFAAAEQRMDSEHRLEGTSLPWLGEPEDLLLDGQLFRVESSLSAYPEGKLLRVTISWEQAGSLHQLQMERVIARHGTDG